MKRSLDIKNFNSFPVKKRKTTRNNKRTSHKSGYIPKSNSCSISGIEYKISCIPGNLNGINITNTHNINENIDEFDEFDNLIENDCSKKTKANESDADSMDISDCHISSEHPSSFTLSPTRVKKRPDLYICYIHNHDQTICGIYDCCGVKTPKFGTYWKADNDIQNHPVHFNKFNQQTFPTIDKFDRDSLWYSYDDVSEQHQSNFLSYII